MSNVLIEKNKLDVLATAIANKSGESLKLTIAEMVEAVDGIEVGGGTPILETVTKTYTPSTTAVTDTITPSRGYDGIEEVDVTVSAVPTGVIGSGIWVDNSTTTTKVYRYARSITQAGYLTAQSIGSTLNLDKESSTITPTESIQSVTPSGAYKYLDSVTVDAIPSNYVGSGITQRSSLDLSASGATVTVPSGYYSAQASKAVASGTAGTPTATKGTVSNHSISVTPSVTNTSGYISGGTINGTAVTVSASELVSGSETKTANGTYDVTNLAELVVNVASGSSKNVQVLQSTSRTNSSSLTKVLGDLTVSKTGTYDVYWSGGRSNTSSSYTWGTRLYVDGSGYGTENTSWTNNCQSNHLSNVSLTANQKLSVYARGRTGSYYTFAPMLVIIEA